MVETFTCLRCSSTCTTWCMSSIISGVRVYYYNTFGKEPIVWLLTGSLIVWLFQLKVQTLALLTYHFVSCHNLFHALFLLYVKLLCFQITFPRWNIERYDVLWLLTNVFLQIKPTSDGINSSCFISKVCLSFSHLS